MITVWGFRVQGFRGLGFHKVANFKVLALAGYAPDSRGVYAYAYSDLRVRSPSVGPFFASFCSGSC